MIRMARYLVAGLGAGIVCWSAGIVIGAAASAPGARPSATAPAASPTELYADITSKYLAAKWEQLPADLAQAKTISAMTKEQQADVTYIKQAVADGRPVWWDKVKQNQKMMLSTRLWVRNVAISFDPALKAGQVQMQQTNGQIALACYWNVADMDSPDQAEHGFTKGDLACVGIWGQIEFAQQYGSLASRLVNLTKAENEKFTRFMVFRSSLAAGYYGTPRARRWTAFLSCDAYLGSHLTNEGFIPRRPFAAMLEEEIVSHIGKYPSIRLPRNQKAETVEGTLANNLMGQFERTTLSFAEDKSLRDAIKEFGTINGPVVFSTGKVTLPSKLAMPLDAGEDGDGATKRGEWLMEEIAHPGVHAEAATRSASKPASTKP